MRPDNARRAEAPACLAGLTLTLTGVRFQGTVARDNLKRANDNGDYVFLEKEHYNPYDVNAISAHVVSEQGDLTKVGYLVRQQAENIVKLVADRKLQFVTSPYQTDETENHYIVCEIESFKLTQRDAPWAQLKVVGLTSKVNMRSFIKQHRKEM